jgi:hypothetical protein
MVVVLGDNMVCSAFSLSLARAVPSPSSTRRSGSAVIRVDSRLWLGLSVRTMPHYNILNSRIQLLSNVWIDRCIC